MRLRAAEQNELTDLLLGNGAQLSRCRDLSGCRTRGDARRFCQRAGRRKPVADFLWEELNYGYARVVLVTLVDTITEVAEPGGGPAWG